MKRSKALLLHRELLRAGAQSSDEQHVRLARSGRLRDLPEQIPVELPAHHPTTPSPQFNDYMTNPLKKGVLTENSAGIGPVTSKMVRRRAAELAVIDGRSEQDASRSECEEARRELTGEPETNPEEAALEAAPESERWDPVPGSTGHKVPVPASDDEDDEGRSDNERLVEEGVAGAELDRIVQAAQAAEKKDGS
jgi:hypothetical protein